MWSRSRSGSSISSRLSSAAWILNDKWSRRKPEPEPATTPWPLLSESHATSDLPVRSKLSSGLSKWKDKWSRRGSRSEPDPASTPWQPSTEPHGTFDRPRILTTGTKRGGAFSDTTGRSVFREDVPLDRSKGGLQPSNAAAPLESPSRAIVDDLRNSEKDDIATGQTQEGHENAGTWAESLTSWFLESKSATSYDESLEERPSQTVASGPRSDAAESQDHDWWRRVKEAHDEGRKLLPALLGTDSQESSGSKDIEHAVIAGHPSTKLSPDGDLSAATPRTRELGGDHSLAASSNCSSVPTESWSNAAEQGTPLIAPPSEDATSDDSSEFLEAKEAARAWWSKEFEGERRSLTPSAMWKRLSNASKDSELISIYSGEDEATLEEAQVATFQSLESLQSRPSLQELPRPNSS